MDGKGQTLFWFHNEKVKVEVPFFQRPYVWDEEDWDDEEEFYDDDEQFLYEDNLKND